MVLPVIKQTILTHILTEILNLEGHQNCCIGYDNFARMSGFCLSGGVALGREASVQIYAMSQGKLGDIWDQHVGKSSQIWLTVVIDTSFSSKGFSNTS